MMKRKIMLIMFIFILIIVSTFVLGYDYHASVNNSELPYYNITFFSLVVSEPSKFIYASNSTFLSFIPEEYVINTTQFEVRINISFDTNLGNYSDNIHIFNNVSNVTTLLNFLFEVYNGTSPLEIVLENETNFTNLSPFLQIDINAFHLSVCDWQLPKFYKLNVSVTSNYQTDVMTICDGWVQCDDPVYLDSNSFAITTLNVSVPQTPHGNYVEDAKFNIIDTTNNITFFISVEDCPLPLPKFGCNEANMTYVEYISCMVNFFIATNTSLSEINNTIYKNVTYNYTTIEYIEIATANDLKDMISVIIPILKSVESETMSINKDTKVVIEENTKLREENTYLKSNVPLEVQKAAAEAQKAKDDAAFAINAFRILEYIVIGAIFIALMTLLILYINRNSVW